MAINSKFRTDLTGEFERKLMQTCVNVGTTVAPIWEAVGYKVEDSSIEYNPDISELTDILGVTHTDVNKLVPSQALDSYTMRGDSLLAQKLFDIQVVRKSLTELKEFEVMLIYGFAGEVGDYLAEIQSNCTVYASSIGGASQIVMPLSIGFSQKSTWGTTDALYPDTITFTETLTP